MDPNDIEGGIEIMIGIAGAVFIAVGALMIAKWIKGD